VSLGAEPDAPGAARAGTLLAGSTLVAVGLAVGQLLGYLLNVLGARILGPTGYGQLGALLGLVLIGNVVALAVQTVASRRTSAGETTPALLAPLGVRFGVAEAAVFLVLVPVLAVTLHLDVVALAAVSLGFLPLTAAGVALGVTQGASRFPRLSAQYAVLAAARTGLALAALLVWHDVRALTLALLVGGVVAWLLVARLAGIQGWAWAATPHGVATETLHVSHALVAMFTFTSVDVLLARSFLDADQAGQYAAGGILIKIAFWLPQAVVVAAFPRMSVREAGALTRSALLVGGIGAALVAAAALLGPTVLPWVLGASYPTAAQHAAVFVLVGVLESVAYLVVFDRLAGRDRNAVWVVWAAVVVLVVLVRVLGTAPLPLAWAVAVSATLLCGAGVLVPRRGDVPESAAL
jgi:O-antigen/teichoic acid export membrane protein